MSNIIDKIQLSGVTYDIGGQGGSGVSVVEVTQAEYDALPSSAKTDTSKMYVITDAEAGDLSQYWTSAETQSAITEATSGKADTSYVDQSVSGKVDTTTYNTYTAATDTAIDGKQATLVSGTNIKTINNESILGSGNIDIQGGGGVTVDPSLDSGSTNPVANSAITNAFNSYTINKNNDNGEVKYFYWSTPNNPWGGATIIKNFSINGRCPLTKTNGSNSYIDKFNLVETSAITTSITSGSTDSQVPSAKAVYDALGRASGGISSAECQSMIDSSISGKADSSSLATVATSGSYNDLTNKPTIPTVPTNVSDFTNDAGYITIDAISGKVDTTTFNIYSGNVETSLSGKQDTLSAGTGIDITDNVISATGGGGKAVSGGTNISVTTGETADTINCTLPITISDSANGSKQSIAIGSGSSAHISNWYDSIAIGKNSKGYFGSVVIGSNPTAYSQGNGSNVAIGNETKFYGDSVIIGNYAEGYNGYNANSIAIGVSARANNIKGAVAIGYNVNTNGTTKTNINNQLKIDTSNQIYVKDKTNTNEVCLQDTIAATAANTTALGGLSLVKLTQAEYDALATKDSNTLYVIVN